MILALDLQKKSYKIDIAKVDKSIIVAIEEWNTKVLQKNYNDRIN